jgi:hypothetical protein
VLNGVKAIALGAVVGIVLEAFAPEVVEPGLVALVTPEVALELVLLPALGGVI